jgi:NAD(P)-dependent dehydrogenase (short-subunit alcohol dehydrogenase family)
MSLANQTCWVVGGVGVIGRGIARSFLQAGANVIVNSSQESRLRQIASDLHNPSGLILVKGDLTPESAQATIDAALAVAPNGHPLRLRHVVAHGAVRYWTKQIAGCDETYSLVDETAAQKRLLDMSPEDFVDTSSRLAALHFNAVKNLLPKLDVSTSTDTHASYTFVTGDGGGHISGKRSATGEINSHHMWGLSAALREELKATNEEGEDANVLCREVRVGLPVNRSMEVQQSEPRDRPLSEDIGDLCVGIAVSTKDNGKLIKIDSQKTLENNLVKFNADKDKNINLPHLWEFNGSL